MGISRTRTVAEFITNTSFEHLPQDVIEKGKLHVLDSIGCALGGSATEFGRKEIFSLCSPDDGGNTSIVGHSVRAALPLAAFINTGLAHVMDYDDTGTNPTGHPGSSIVQTGLAVGEKTRATGKQLLTAIVLGYEVALRIGRAIRPSPQRAREGPVSGWIGFGSTAVASKLFGLNADQTQLAFGAFGCNLEGSVRQPASEHGLRWVSDGRPGLYKVGMGNKAFLGVVSAQRGRAYYPAPVNIFDGFFWTALNTDQYSPEIVDDKLSEEFLIHRMALKPYPCCRYLHPVLDAVRNICHTENIDPSCIKRIHVTGYRQLQHLAQLVDPKDIWEIEFSLPITIGLALSGEEPGLGWLDLQKVNHPVIRSLAGKVVFTEEPAYSAAWFGERKLRCTVEIETTDNQRHALFAQGALGDPDRPMTAEHVVKKFLGIAVQVIGRQTGESIVETVLKLEDCNDIGRLTSLYTQQGTN